MKIIAHRANLTGKGSSENEPAGIIKAIDAGFDVEIDVRIYENKLWLGHSGPEYELSFEFLKEIIPYAWIHCKDLDALDFFASRPDLKAQYFWHQTDDYTVTSHGIIWAFPGKPVTPNSVILLPEYNDYIIDKSAYGICTDVPYEMVGLLNA